MEKVFNKYTKKIINYDLLNKFDFKSLNHIPFLSKIILKFDFKVYDYKLLIRCLFILELLSGKLPKIIKSKRPNIFLKLKKGIPIGCKVNLKNINMLKFLIIFINLPKSIFSKSKIKSNNKQFSLNMILFNVLNLPLLQNNYHFFKNIKNLNITFITLSKHKQELLYLLYSYKVL